VNPASTEAQEHSDDVVHPASVDHRAMLERTATRANKVKMEVLSRKMVHLDVQDLLVRKVLLGSKGLQEMTVGLAPQALPVTLVTLVTPERTLKTANPGYRVLPVCAEPLETAVTVRHHERRMDTTEDEEKANNAIEDKLFITALYILTFNVLSHCFN